MMKRIIAGILILTIIMSGAGCKGSDEKKEEETRKQQTDTVIKEKDPDAVNGTEEPEQPESDEFLLKFYTDQYSEEYQELGQAQVWLPGFFENTESKKIRFCSTADDVFVTLELGQWLEAPLRFRTTEYVFNVATKADTVYEFGGYLSECISMYRITAFKGDKTAVWYMMEDGKDGKQVFEVAGEEAKAVLPEEDDPILSLCSVYGVLSVKAGDDIANMPEYFWDAITNAVTSVTLQTADADSEGNIYLDSETMNEYVTAMFPEIGVYPELKEDDGVIWPENMEDYFVVKANFDVEDYRVKMESMEVIDEKSVKITFIVAGGTEETAIVYISPVSEMKSPFKWIIQGADIAKG